MSRSTTGAVPDDDVRPDTPAFERRPGGSDHQDRATRSTSPDGERWTGSWRDEPPSDEGFFWYCEPRFEITDVVRVFYSPSGEEWRASGSLYAGRNVKSMDGQWAGPIPRPDIPPTGLSEK